MNEELDPVRLLSASSEASPLVRSVLGAANQHDPLPEQLASLQAKLTVALGATASGASTMGPVMKLLLSALAVVAATGAGALLVTRSHATQPPVVGAIDADEHEPAALPLPASASAPASPPVSSVPIGVASVAPLSDRAPVVAPVRTAPVASGDEATLLGNAHRALMAGDPKKALALAEEHRTNFPKGALNQEREMIAIQALIASGDHAKAKERATNFRAKYPQSSHLPRLNELVAPP